MLVDGVLGELGGAGGLQEGRLADLALDIHGLDVLEGRRARDQSAGTGGGEKTKQPREGSGRICPQAHTIFSCDLAAPLASFALRSRFC